MDTAVHMDIADTVNLMSVNDTVNLVSVNDTARYSSVNDTAGYINVTDTRDEYYKHDECHRQCKGFPYFSTSGKCMCYTLAADQTLYQPTNRVDCECNTIGSSSDHGSGFDYSKSTADIFVDNKIRHFTDVYAPNTFAGFAKNIPNGNEMIGDMAIKYTGIYFPVKQKESKISFNFVYLDEPEGVVDVEKQGICLHMRDDTKMCYYVRGAGVDPREIIQPISNFTSLECGVSLTSSRHGHSRITNLKLFNEKEDVKDGPPAPRNWQRSKNKRSKERSREVDAEVYVDEVDADVYPDEDNADVYPDEVNTDAYPDEVNTDAYYDEE
eukprot:5928905-Ditylum_brightwellii.AAC.2